MGNISPEEKLLRLIRGQKKQPQLPKTGPGSSGLSQIKPQGAPISLSRWQKYFSRLDKRKIMVIIFSASCLYLIVTLIYPLFGLREIKISTLQKQNISSANIEPKIDIKPYDYYLEGVKGRSIFAGGSSENMAGQPVNVSADLIKNINLVGVVAGDNPQAIIEDKSTQKTYYLNKGQFLGEFQVDDIQEGKVILNYQGQRFELHL